MRETTANKVPHPKRVRAFRFFLYHLKLTQLLLYPHSLTVQFWAHWLEFQWNHLHLSAHGLYFACLLFATWLMTLGATLTS